MRFGHTVINLLTFGFDLLQSMINWASFRSKNITHFLTVLYTGLNRLSVVCFHFFILWFKMFTRLHIKLRFVKSTIMMHLLYLLFKFFSDCLSYQGLISSCRKLIRRVVKVFFSDGVVVDSTFSCWQDTHLEIITVLLGCC